MTEKLRKAEIIIDVQKKVAALLGHPIPDLDQEEKSWYKEEHRHSGLGLLTPAMVHYGQAERILQQRQAVLDVAYQLHPERFVRSAPKPPQLLSEVWINKPVHHT